MPTYDVTDPSSGLKIRLTGDAPPSEQELDNIFAEARSRQQQPAQPSVGELRRREGAGEIAAAPPQAPLSLTPATDNAVSQSFFDQAIKDLGKVIGGGSVEGFPVTEFGTEARAGEMAGAEKQFKKVAPIAAGVVASEAMAPAALATTLPKMIGQFALQGGVGGVAQQATEEAVTGFQPGALGRVGFAGAESAAIGVPMAGFARYAPAGIEMASEFFKSGADRMKRIGAVMYKPAFSPSLDAINANEARGLIKSVTGIDVPVGVGEAIGNPEIVNYLKKTQVGAEVPDEVKEQLKRQITFSAMRLKNSQISSEDLAKDTIGILKNELGSISKPVEDAINKLSNDLAPSIQSAFNEVQNSAKALVPGTAATPSSLGERIKSFVKSGYDKFKETDRLNFEAAKANPFYKEVKVKPSAIRDWANDLESSTVQMYKASPEETTRIVNQFGDPFNVQEVIKDTKAIPSMLPEGTRAYVGAIGNMADEQSIDSLRRMRTMVGESIGQQNVLPGLSDAAKSRLYSAITKDINDTVDSLPTSTLKDALSKANTFHRENVDKYVFKRIENIINPTGEAGGATPASIMAKLEGKDAKTYLDEIYSAARPEDISGIDSTVSEYLFNEIGNSARNPVTGEVSVGKVIQGIEKLSPELQRKFFPNIDTIKSLARRQAAVSEIRPETVIKNLEVDPVLLSEALADSKKTKSITDSIAAALNASDKMEKQLQGTVLGALSKNNSAEVADAVLKNPTGFVRSITGGSFTNDQVNKTFNLIARENPELAAQLQFSYLDDLFSSYSKEGGINTAKLLNDLKSESAFKKATDVRGRTEAILGSGKTSNLETILGSLAKLDKASTGLTERSPLIEVLARGTGAIIGETAGSAARVGPIGMANQASALSRLMPSLKYNIAATILTTQELRQIAMKPISQVTREDMNLILRNASQLALAKYGPDSPETSELKSLVIKLTP